MTELDAIYNTTILELAAAIPRTARLEHPDASATAHSKLCGSTVSVDLVVDGDLIAEFGQTVKACLLGQASASVVGREIVGSTCGEFRELAETMRAMLKDNGPPPTGKWADLAVLEPVRDYKARHTSTLLVFEAVGRALDEIAGRHCEAGRACSA
jgi:NifU-like protein involved in Fe-S cluster formation